MLDSLYLNHINVKLDSLINVVENQQISTSYYQSILDHQWALLQAQTAIFVGIVLMILTIVSLIAWKAFFSKLIKRISAIEKKFENLTDNVDKVELIENQLKIVNTHTHRNLYESAQNPKWRVIWHIRYCEVLFDRQLIDPLIIRLNTLENEFDVLLQDPDLFQQFLKFENMGGLKDTLRKLINYKDDMVSKTPSKILDKILNSK